MNNILRNPFETYSENKLLTIGSIVTILFSYISYLLYSRLDGLLDIHFTEHIKYYQPLFDNLINILVCTLLLFILGQYINRKTRFIDILAVSIVARIPFYPLILVNINNYLSDTTKVIVDNANSEAVQQIPPSTLAIILVFSILAIAALICYMILLYKGFKTATNSKGKKPLALFIITILLIELISKMSINFLNY